MGSSSSACDGRPVMRLALLASGRGSNVAAILEAIRAGRLEAEAVILVCDRPGAPVSGLAEDVGVTVRLLPRSGFADRAAWDAAVRAVLLEARADLVALAGFAAILGPAVLAAFPGRILNIHPSLLPAFGGGMAPAPQEAALRAGVTTTGCTVHVVTADVDGGPIMAQARVPVLPGDSVASLSDRILAAEHRLYPDVLGWFASGWVRVEEGRVYRHRPREAAGHGPLSGAL
ncbi:phosphoribosylglycinamide formyltransferase [soil metagenome]